MKILPNTISPCPILETTVELKFQPQIPKETIVGVLYEAVKKDFPELKKLPNAMLPINIIEQDPNFKHKTLYMLQGESFRVQVGFDVVSFHCITDYVGWNSYSHNMRQFLEKLYSTQIIGTLDNILLRYLNFFEIDIYENINFSLQLAGEVHTSKSLAFRTQIMKDGFENTLQLANDVTITKDNDAPMNGSLIDIICSYNCVKNNKESITTDEIVDIVNKAHDIEKDLFFKLLKEEFIKTLSPTYKTQK